MKKIKQFVKELKRVKWPTPAESANSFWTSLVFIIIVSLVLFAVALVLGFAWQSAGIGV